MKITMKILLFNVSSQRKNLIKNKLASENTCSINVFRVTLKFNQIGIKVSSSI